MIDNGEKRKCWECRHHSGNLDGCWCNLTNKKVCFRTGTGIMKPTRGHKLACDKFLERIIIGPRGRE